MYINPKSSNNFFVLACKGWRVTKLLRTWNNFYKASFKSKYDLYMEKVKYKYVGGTIISGPDTEIKWPQYVVIIILNMTPCKISDSCLFVTMQWIHEVPIMWKMDKSGVQAVIKYFALKCLTPTDIKNELDSTLKKLSPSFSTFKNGLLDLNVLVHQFKMVSAVIMNILIDCVRYILYDDIKKLWGPCVDNWSWKRDSNDRDKCTKKSKSGSVWREIHDNFFYIDQAGYLCNRKRQDYHRGMLCAPIGPFLGCD